MVCSYAAIASCSSKSRFSTRPERVDSVPTVVTMLLYPRLRILLLGVGGRSPSLGSGHFIRQRKPGHVALRPPWLPARHRDVRKRRTLSPQRTWLCIGAHTGIRRLSEPAPPAAPS